MIVKLKNSWIDILEKYSIVNTSDTTFLSNEGVPMVIVVTVGIVLIFLLFLFIAYFLPWWCLYNKCCSKCVEQEGFNCINYFYTCPCLDNRARVQQNMKVQNFDKIYIQDLLTTVDGRTSDGRIIQLSNLRANRNKNFKKNKNIEINIV